MADLSRQM